MCAYTRTHMDASTQPRIGYACISTEMRAKGVFCSRTARVATVTPDGRVDVSALIDLARQNVADLQTILEYNLTWGCRFFRITSNLFPHWGNPKLGASAHYDLEFARSGLRAAGDYARAHGMRITAHPGQFAQMGSADPAILAQTYTDLGLHARVFEMMGLTPQDGTCMVIHGGGVWGDKDAALRRFADAYERMPAATRQYIVLENDEFNYSVYDLLPFCERVGIPFVIDFFHHAVWSRRNDSPYEAIYGLSDRIVATWRGRRPKCHYSEQAPDGRDGAHSDTIGPIPREILAFARVYCADIMLEVKEKDTVAKAVLARHFRQVVGADGAPDWVLK